MIFGIILQFLMCFQARGAPRDRQAYYATSPTPLKTIPKHWTTIEKLFPEDLGHQTLIAVTLGRAFLKLV